MAATSCARATVQLLYAASLAVLVSAAAVADEIPESCPEARQFERRTVQPAVAAFQQSLRRARGPRSPCSTAGGYESQEPLTIEQCASFNEMVDRFQQRQQLIEQCAVRQARQQAREQAQPEPTRTRVEADPCFARDEGSAMCRPTTDSRRGYGRLFRCEQPSGLQRAWYRIWESHEACLILAPPRALDGIGYDPAPDLFQVDPRPGQPATTGLPTIPGSVAPGAAAAGIPPRAATGGGTSPRGPGTHGQGIDAPNSTISGDVGPRTAGQPPAQRGSSTPAGPPRSGADDGLLRQAAACENNAGACRPLADGSYAWGICRQGPSGSYWLINRDNACEPPRREQAPPRQSAGQSRAPAPAGEPQCRLRQQICVPTDASRRAGLLRYCYLDANARPYWSAESYGPCTP